MNTKKTTKKKRKRTTALPPKSSHLCLLRLLCLLFSLSLSLSDVLCGVKIFRRSLTKNSATNSLGYTTLTSYPALSLWFFIQNLLTFYIPKRVYAHIREVKKSERASLERERLKERESVRVFIILLFLREKR